ncbi:cell surface protein (plasmid) [Borreliella turdi]|uniref:cell surface protein n=1 Tax=Borreliella turdi TaxID=57863 RepID=UPI0026494496|nr:cell surface protein [Borreliella turdi]WKC78462.1 cell surface protein [Borreliella turdi]
MKQYLLGFTLVFALIACAQKGANLEQGGDVAVSDASNEEENSNKDLSLKAEDLVTLFNGSQIFVSKEKNKDGKYELRAIVDTVEIKGVADKNNGSGKLEGVKPDNSKVKMSITDDLNTITVETHDSSDKKVSSKVLKKHGSLTEESYKANKLDSKKLTRSNDTTLEYSEMTNEENATKAVETLKNGIKFEGSLVGGKTTLKITEGTVTLTREIDKDGKLKIYLNDTASSSKKTGSWNDITNTLTISANSKKTKDLVFLTDGTITVQSYDSGGTALEGSATEIKNLTELTNELK